MDSKTISPDFHYHNPKPIQPPPPPPSFRPRPNFSGKFRRRGPAVRFPECLPLHSKNPRAIYSDIQRFARSNQLSKAFTILDYLDHRGVPVNATTFAALIAAASRSKSLPDARRIHAFIRVNNLDNNEFLRTKLVHMYSSCGSLDDARQLFDEMPTATTASVYPWNALLRGSVVAGGRRFRDGAAVFRQMREVGVEMNAYSFSSAAKSFAGAGGVSQGMKLHALSVKNGLLGDVLVTTSLVDLYFKCGKVKLALRLFDEVDEEDYDVVLFGTMIAGFAHNKLELLAIEFFRTMVRLGIGLNSAVLTAILPAIGSVSQLKLGREIHAYAVKTKGYANQSFVHSAIVDLYCKCGDMVNARRVFYGAKDRNAVSWTALISGYAANGRAHQALRAVAWMQREGSNPDVVTVATVVPICSELRALKSGKEIHCFAVKNGFFPNVSIVSSLMVMYSKCGVLQYSARLFEGSVERRNVIVWTAMIRSYFENGFCSEALNVARSMAVSKHRPDSVAVGTMLSVCGRVKSLKLGKEIHGHVLKKGFESVHFVAAEIVKMYGSCGEVGCSTRAFEAIGSKGSITWSAIMEAYRSNGLYREAIKVFDRMRDEDFTPNQLTFKAALCVCDEGGLVDDARRVFDLMTHRYKIDPRVEHYSLIIGVLTRFGHKDEAQKFEQLCSYL